MGPPDTFSADFPFAIACPRTTARRGLSLHVEVEQTDSNGLDLTSCTQCALIRSVNRRRPVHRIGTIDTVTSARVAQILTTLLAH